CATDFDHPEELQTVAGWPIGLEVRRDTEELHLRPKGVIELVRAKGPSMQGSGNEFPEGVEVGELGLRWIIEMGRCVVHVCREPHDVLDGVVLEESEQVCQLQLAAKRWAITVGPGLKSQNVRHLQAKWHVTSDDLPGGPGVEQSAFQPLHLRRAEEGRVSTRGLLTILRVGAAVAALVEHEDVEGWTITESAIDALRVMGVEAYGGVFAKGAFGIGR